MGPRELVSLDWVLVFAVVECSKVERVVRRAGEEELDVHRGERK